MEASESPQISFKRAESRGVLRLVGNGPAVQELIANDDHRTGFARLELMVSTVLERLTATEAAGRSGPTRAPARPRS